MPEYEFFNEEGEYRSVFMHAAQAPSIGDLIEHEGETLRRVPSVPGVSAGFKPFVSYSLSRNDRHASDFDRQGRPCFNSERSVREFMAKNNNDPLCTKMAWG